MALPRQPDPDEAPKPIYVVWELTLRCDLACRHCGSRAGKARPDELDLPTSLRVLGELAALGTREITFIGGEAYLSAHWLDLIRATREAGIRPTLTTGGRAWTLERAQAARADLLLDEGIEAWQVQLTGPMGRAADQPDWLLQPYELLDLLPRLSAVADRALSRGCVVSAANNLGYYGPYESRLRRAPWQGCGAGRYTLGIESHGDVKGCPSLPSAPYVGGNVRERSLRQIWEEAAPLRFTRERGEEELWGYCASCYYAPLCKGGCAWTSHTALGRRGNMPWCFHRAEQLAAQGLRERVVREEAAPGEPFDFGRYRLVVEAADGGAHIPVPAELSHASAAELVSNHGL